MIASNRAVERPSATKGVLRRTPCAPSAVEYVMTLILVLGPTVWRRKSRVSLRILTWRSVGPIARMSIRSREVYSRIEEAPATDVMGE